MSILLIYLFFDLLCNWFHMIGFIYSLNNTDYKPRDVQHHVSKGINVLLAVFLAPYFGGAIKEVLSIRQRTLFTMLAPMCQTF